MPEPAGRLAQALADNDRIRRIERQLDAGVQVFPRADISAVLRALRLAEARADKPPVDLRGRRAHG